MRPLRQVWAAAGAAVGALLLAPTAALAVPVVSWNAPPGATFNVGDTIVLSGNANSSGTVGGSGLDLALVLDNSGSMGSVESGKTRLVWLKEAANALVDALPAASTSVAVVEFDSSSFVRTALTPLSSGLATVKAGINAGSAGGGTNIPVGITAGTAQVTGAAHTAGRTQMLVVVSDGVSSGNPGLAAAGAVAAGVDAVHSVGIPGHDAATMQAIATQGNGIYTNASVLTQLINIFNGTAGNLVGIDRVNLLMNDGTVVNNIATDGLGNFSAPLATLFAGTNTFTATAFDAAGASAVASLTITVGGGGGGGNVPEPGVLGLLAVALAAAVWAGRRRQVGTGTASA